MPTRKLVTRYRDDLRVFPDLWHKVGLVLGVAFVLGFPFYVGDHWLGIGNLALVAVVGSVSLMIVTGFAGQISLGHAGFLAIGAYTAAIAGTAWNLPYYLVMPLAGLICAGVGVAIGAFALRLEGLYLAIVTIGLVEIVEHMLMSFPDLTGGYNGHDVPMYTWFSDAEAMADAGDMAYGPLVLGFEQRIYFVFLVVAVLVAWAAKNLHRSNAGRAMMAVRDHDLAASALGVNPARAKIVAFAISSFFAGVAGAMFAYQQKLVTPGQFNLQMSILYVAMIVLGGIGVVFGAVAGAVAIVVMTPLMEDFAAELPLLSDLSTSLQSTVLFSVLVIVFLVLEPLGLFGVWMRLKRYFAAWPFRY